MRKAAWGIAVAALAAAALIGTAGAQDADYNAQVRGYLDNGAAVHAERGHRAVRAPEMIAPLENGTSQLWQVNVRRGTNYVFYGACDDDCSDLDMEVYGPDGRLADTDILPDDTPFVQLRPDANGRATVRVWLASCSAEPCYVGVRAMSGGESVDRSTIVAAEDGPAYLTRVREILDASSERHATAGYALLGQEVMAAVALEGDGHRQTLNAEAGRRYRVQAACDQDCSDIDIEVLDSDGQQVASDFAFDNNPFVEFTAARSGAYTARVWLVTCSQEPCFVGVRTFTAGAQ
ncbi:MAG: hypothetical protein GC189_07165 [Alphaproteobacteria bacterium]|nr:hypothetical protein [Alphaproteobacteria bacterium]